MRTLVVAAALLLGCDSTISAECAAERECAANEDCVEGVCVREVTCAEQAAVLDCGLKIATCRDEGSTAPPRCECPPRSVDVSGTCEALCADRPGAFCAPGAESFCADPLAPADPACRCQERHFDRDGRCVQGCSLTLENNPDICEEDFGENFVGACPNGDDAPVSCGCADGFRLVDGEPGPADGELACIRQRCVDLLPYIYCVNSIGEPDPNCSCTCDTAEAPEDDPECFCNEGFVYSPGNDACIPES